MEPSSPAPQGDELLVHGRFLRGLARALVTDTERAEDLVQDTWTRALENPPRHGTSLRAWLAQILRRLAAKKGLRESERGAREALAVRARPACEAREPGGIVAEIELTRRVLESVERLREPYRSTLYLRYYRGLTPQLIAAEQRAPVKTVKTRLARGLELLREDLDRQHGGRRETWVALLLPLAAGARPAPLELTPSAPALPLVPALSGVAMTGAALVLAAVAVGGALWLTRDATRSPGAELAPRAPLMPAPAVPIADAAVVGARSVRTPERAASPAVPALLRLRGRVLDPEGEPVAGAEVAGLVLEPERRGPFRRGPADASESAAGARTSSDAQGAFELSLARPGLARLSIEGDGWAPLGRKLLVFLGQDLDLGTFVLEPGVLLAGRVLDADGRPVADAELWQERLDEGLAFGPGSADPVRVGQCDADGRFELRRQAVGEWRLEARSSLHAPATLSGATRFAGERVTDLELVLAPGARVRGRVLGLDAAELARVSVIARLTEDEHDGARARRVMLDELGAFELSGLAQGAEVELQALLDEPGRGGAVARAQPARARASTDNAEEVLLYLERASGVPRAARAPRGSAADEVGEASGTAELLVLRLDGTPAAGELVALRSGASGEPRRRAAGDIRAADGAGRLRWTGLAPGVHEFRVVAGVFGIDAAAGESWHALRVAADEVAELELPAAQPAELSGSVNVAGIGLAGAELLLRPASGAGATRGAEGPALAVQSLVVQSNAEGRFAFPALAPGSYRLELFHGERAVPEERVLELPAGATELVLALGEARARGLARAADGSPLAGARVRALPAEGEGAGRDDRAGRGARSTTTDAEGRFELAGLEPGRTVRLQATLAGHAVHLAAPEVPEVFQELVLVPEARLALELVSDELSFVLLRAQGPHGERHQRGLAAGRVTSLTGLAPGTWSLELVSGSPRGPRSAEPLAQRTLELTPGTNELHWRVP